MKATLGIATMASIIMAVVLGACAGDDPDKEVLVQIGATHITNAAVTHWMSVLAPRHVLSSPPRYLRCVAARIHNAQQVPKHTAIQECKEQYALLKESAVDFLITSTWLHNEAAAEGMRVLATELTQRLAERERTYVGGPAEFRQTMHAIDHTMSDVRLEVANELASERLTRRVLRSIPAVTPAEIATYYKTHISAFQNGEQRQFFIVEDLASKQAAQTRISELMQGTRKIANAGESLYESLERPSDLHTARTIVKVIFRSRLGVLSQPVRVGAYYFLIQVAHVTPAATQRLAEVRHTIYETLTLEHQEYALTRFIAAWRRRWTAQTNCSSGYVIQKCRQYRGRRNREAPLSFN